MQHLPRVLRLSDWVQQTCGNAGESAPVQVNLSIPGCASAITGFASNPQVLGADDGSSNGNQLVVTIGGTVELLDANCSGAPVQLLVDGGVAANGLVPPSGNVSFGNVTLTEGVRNVRLRVGPVAGNTLESANQSLEVDLSAPVVAVVQPGNGADLLTDSNPGLAGQQALVQVSVTENVVVTERTATLQVDGVPVGGSVAVANTSPATISIPDVTLSAGNRSLEVCVVDSVGNSGCAQWQVNADPGAPDPVGNLTATIVDPRSAEVRLDFIAPGDDGAGGGTVSGLQFAEPTRQFSTKQLGIMQRLVNSYWHRSVSRVKASPLPFPVLGQGLPWPDGLLLNQTHHLAVRAMDEAGRMGALSQIEADLAWGQVIESFPPSNGQWTDNPFFNNTSLVAGLGDIDQDGFDDVLVTAVQGATQFVASVSFGRPEGDPVANVDLLIPPSINSSFFATAGAALGDVNGDGIGDFGVMGLDRPSMGPHSSSISAAMDVIEL